MATSEILTAHHSHLSNSLPFRNVHETSDFILEYLYVRDFVPYLHIAFDDETFIFSITLTKKFQRRRFHHLLGVRHIPHVYSRSQLSATYI